MTALNQGATLAQAAGVTVGGSRTLSGAARTLAYLPGVRNTSLGEAAEQFTEGSITRQVAAQYPRRRSRRRADGRGEAADRPRSG